MRVCARAIWYIPDPNFARSWCHQNSVRGIHVCTSPQMLSHLRRSTLWRYPSSSSRTAITPTKISTESYELPTQFLSTICMVFPIAWEGISAQAQEWGFSYSPFSTLCLVDIPVTFKGQGRPWRCRSYPLVSYVLPNDVITQDIYLRSKLGKYERHSWTMSHSCLWLPLKRSSGGAWAL